MSPTITIVVNAVAVVLYFAAGWFLRHHTMPAPDPAAPAAPADPALPNFGGVLGPVLQAVEQQIMAGIAAHVGGIFQMPVAQPVAIAGSPAAPAAPKP